MRVRALNCPTCGGRTRLSHGESTALCIHCGGTVKLSDAVLQEGNAGRAYPPRTPLRLGMKAMFEGKEFELTGRQVMRQMDAEDVSVWEEWVLIAADGDLVYLEFDEGKWKFSRPFVPSEPISTEQLTHMQPGLRLPLDGGVTVSDTGHCELRHAEGEFPFVVTPGKRVYYVGATRGAEFFSVEWTEDAIEFYRGRFLSERQVYTYFGLTDLLRALDRRDETIRSRRWFGAFCIGLSLVLLIIWVQTFFSGQVAPNGRGSVTLAQATGNGVRFGPIPLKAVNRVHRIEVSGRMSEESNWVQAILEDPDQKELISAEQDMWDESGVDSDGRWHESELRASADFVLVKPGNYYVRLFAEPEPGKTPSSTASASFELRERAMTPLWPGLVAFLALFVGIGYLVAGSSGASLQTTSAG